MVLENPQLGVKNVAFLTPNCSSTQKKPPRNSLGGVLFLGEERIVTVASEHGYAYTRVKKIAVHNSTSMVLAVLALRMSLIISSVERLSFQASTNRSTQPASSFSFFAGARHSPNRASTSFTLSILNVCLPCSSSLTNLSPTPALSANST